MALRKFYTVGGRVHRVEKSESNEDFAARKKPRGHKQYTRVSPKGKIVQVKEKPYAKEPKKPAGMKLTSEELKKWPAEAVMVAPLVRDKKINVAEAKLLMQNISSLEEKYKASTVQTVAEGLNRGYIEHGFDKAGFRNIQNFENILGKYGLTKHEKYSYKGYEGRPEMATNVWSGKDVKLITSGDPREKGGRSHYIGIEGKKEIADKIFHEIHDLNDFSDLEWGTAGFIGSPSEEDVKSGEMIKLSDEDVTRKPGEAATNEFGITEGLTKDGNPFSETEIGQNETLLAQRSPNGRWILYTVGKGGKGETKVVSPLANEEAAKDYMNSVGKLQRDVDSEITSLRSNDYGESIEFDNGEEWLIFRNVSDAEDAAKENLLSDKENLINTVDKWVLQENIDKDRARSYFEDMYREWDESYARDIATEDDPDTYRSGNRLLDEMMDANVLTEEEAAEYSEVQARSGGDLLDFIPNEKVETFANIGTEDKLSSDGIGYEHYSDNFGEEEADKLMLDQGFYNADGVVDTIVSTDGWAHVLGNYDGNAVSLEGDTVTTRLN